MTITFKSKKDGHHQTDTSFDSYCPNTYTVFKNGDEVGTVWQIRDPDYNFKTTAWQGLVWQNGEHEKPTSFKAQYLGDLKAKILTAC